MWCWLFPTFTLSTILFFGFLFRKRLLFLYHLSLTKYSTTTSGSKFILNSTGTSALITYYRDNESYQLNIPFNRDLIRKMSGSKVYLIIGNKQVNITQQPGIPYSVTAREMGGEKIVIKKGDKIIEFGLDEIPKF